MEIYVPHEVIMTPKLVLLFSGKRKSGKDYLTDHLEKRLGNDICEVIKISWPIKEHWAKEKNLSLDDLLSDGPLKEAHRVEMIEWSDEVRRRDYGRFCYSACSMAHGKQIMIVSDIRRKSDIRWFTETYKDKVRTIRIQADDDTRSARGYRFVSGVDDVASECDLDDYTDWDVIINNGKGGMLLEDQLKLLVNLIERS